MTAANAASPRRFERVPPHDVGTEEALLGAALIRTEAAQLVAGLDPDDFYKPSHRLIAAVVRQLHLEQTIVDAATVTATLRQQGQLDAAGGPSTVTTLIAAAATLQAAHKLAGMVADYAQRRRILGLAAELVNALYENTDPAGLIGEMHKAAEARAAGRPTTWQPVNLAATLAGEGDQVVPTVLARTDGHHLLYPGKIHAFNAEPEAGKSWLAQHACAVEIRGGRHVLYVDFEGGAADVTQRLLELGCHPDQIIERFHYIRPNDPFDTAASLAVTAALDAWPVTFAVVDGVAEALALNGWKENDAADVTAFFVALPRMIARHGAAVVIIDHVVKDREGQGRYGRGSGAKLAGIDGATYKLETVRPFARGANGMSKLIVTKDRHGHVRANAHKATVAGEMHMTSNADGTAVTVEIRPLTTDSSGPFRPTGYMEKVSRELETLDLPQSVNSIRRVTHGKGTVVVAAVQALVKEGYIEVVPGPRNSLLHRSVKPYREADDNPPQPVDNRYEPDPDELF